MTFLKALRGPLLVSGLITALLIAAAIAFAAWPTGGDAGAEELEPLSPSGTELAMLGLAIPFTFVVVLALVLLVSWLRSTRRTRCADNGT